MVKIAHGSLRRHAGSPARWSGAGISSATLPARRLRSRPTIKPRINTRGTAPTTASR